MKHKWDDQGGPAFPAQDAVFFWPGMTLRDYFAIRALPTVMVASDPQHTLSWPEWIKRTAEASYEVADAMLEARK